MTGKGYHSRGEDSTIRTYIIGAGFAGRALAREVQENTVLYNLAAFLDDDPAKIGTKLDGVAVLGPIADVLELIQCQPGDEAIIAIPSASMELLKEIYFRLKRAGFDKIRIVPGIAQIVEGSAHLIQARKIESQDLLQRKTVPIRLKESIGYLKGKRVLITGAGGSIGSELSRQLLLAGVARLFLFGHGENSIYQIHRELSLLQEASVGVRTDIVPVIGELQDRDHIQFILKRLRADAIFHTAAYKHVPLAEANPVAAINNNVFGTKNLVDSAIASAVQRFVLISSDKAVDPVSVYGITKYLAERIVLDAARTCKLAAASRKQEAGSQKHFMVVRFGNVLGSRGSIVPLFREQIEKGGPVTVTDKEARRFFMTIPEACSLVLKTGGVGLNEQLYLLDMGEPVRIADLAEQMIRFYGFEPHKDIAIEYIGLRPGERCNEMLTAPDEKLVVTQYPGILQLERDVDVPHIGVQEGELSGLLADLRQCCFLTPGKHSLYRNRKYLRSTLQRFFQGIEAAANEPEY